MGEPIPPEGSKFALWESIGDAKMPCATGDGADKCVGEIEEMIVCRLRLRLVSPSLSELPLYGWSRSADRSGRDASCEDATGHCSLGMPGAGLVVIKLELAGCSKDRSLEASFKLSCLKFLRRSVFVISMAGSDSTPGASATGVSFLFG